MTVIHLPRQRHRSHPLICFIDLQREYVSPGRALAVDGTDPWLRNCQRMLAVAREHRLPIAHFRQLRRGPFLNPTTSFAEWIEDFRPRPSEMVFERSLPSIYSADGFPAMTEHMDDPFLVLVGLTSSGACMATAVDCFHRSHSNCFIADASWSQPMGGVDAKQSNEVAGEIIRQYSDVMTTDEAVTWLKSEQFSLVG